MSEFALYREPVLLDVAKHRDLKLVPLADRSMASGLHASFLAVAEFVHAAREFVIVFVRNEVEGGTEVQPIVMLGVAAGENLFVESAAGSTWQARYVPAYIRRYPFTTTRLEGQAGSAVMFDAWWKGFSRTEGDPLYESDNKAAPRLAEVVGFLEQFDLEAARTLEFCNRLVALDLLRDMTANVTLPSGQTMALGGFLVVDEAKLQALPDAQVVEMHRNGMMAMLYAHLASLDNLQGLLDRKARRVAGPPH